MLRRKRASLFLFFCTVLAIIIGVAYRENKLVFFGVFTGWYLVWKGTIAFCTPYRWQFKAKEMVYAMWMILVTGYLFFIKEYILVTVFYLPVSIHFSLWREEKENIELNQMIKEMKKTKDKKQLDWLKHEMKNKDHAERYEEWLADIAEIEEFKK